MTENKDKHADKQEQDKKTSDIETDKEHEKDKEPHDRNKMRSQLLDILPVVIISGDRQQPQNQQNQQQQQPLSTLGEELRVGAGGTFYRSASVSFQSEILLLDMDTGEVSDFSERLNHKDEFGTQRVYKKTSPNCVLTLYLPTREITLSGNSPSILRGIVFVDPKAIAGYRVYAQLTLTFRYGREDEEVMGLRFCNEAIMSLHQVWPRNEEPARESLSPLQEALVKRLGDGAHPFTLTLTSQAPPSVQLVPAKRYYGAPIGTSYDVRCFIADKTDDKFHRRASVKMGVRVIYRTDVFQQHANGPENFAALINSAQTASPPMTANALTTTPPAPQLQPPPMASQPAVQEAPSAVPTQPTAPSGGSNGSGSTAAVPPESGSGAAAPEQRAAGATSVKPRKSERGDSFPKLRLSPKSFRFSGRFGRSKSEIEKCPNDPFHNYSKSFQEYDNSSVVATAGGGPQGAVDKPFLLQDGRVSLRASLDKAWYTHGEDVCVTVNIRNDSRKTVRKVRVCAIQHVDVCMFNNGKFKNVVADSDIHSPVERTVPPGGTLNTAVVLRPQRGPTKNWIALEDTLQRSTEPDEITGAIAASAIRSPISGIGAPSAPGQSPQPQSQACASPAAAGIPAHGHAHSHGGASCVGDDRNVFAIYVSYYVKVKLTLSGMGGELSLKLPFVLVHVDSEGGAAPPPRGTMEKLALDDVPACRRNGNRSKMAAAALKVDSAEPPLQQQQQRPQHALDRIESVDDDELHIRVPITALSRAGGSSNGNGSQKRRLLVRSETIAKDLDEETDEQLKEGERECEVPKPTAAHAEQQPATPTNSSVELEQLHVVQIHVPAEVVGAKHAEPSVDSADADADAAASAEAASSNGGV